MYHIHFYTRVQRLYVIKNLFIFGHDVSALLCVRAFSSHGEKTSHYEGFSCYGAWALGHTGSAVVVYGLSCPAGCGIFPDQELNPCPLL